MRLHVEYEHEIPVNAFIWSPDTHITPLHHHASLEIGCCISGVGRFYFGSKQYEVAPGDLFIVNHTERHIACSDVHNPSTYLFLKFEPSLLLAENERLLLPFSIPSERFQNMIPASSGLSNDILPLMEKIWSEIGSRQEGYAMLVKGLLLQICARLLRYYSSELTPHDWGKLTESFLKFRLITAYIREHLHEPLQLSDLAETLQLSPSRVSRLFQDVVGRGFKEYLLLLRLADARRMLVRTDMTVTDICFASGFQSVSSFYRVFVQSEGLSPLAYRKKYSVNAIIENYDL
ncbi:AraC family transcriptional regulator [Paenibacillus lautus]|uniref:AraC family transcriptional regulator n=1 Tax=Paenibacillus lautus TaxID=1401 RepID=UPI001C125DA8|nr:AraC family transcriptional regulator [Paenibacillus lautus]MBU5348310.1 AraC family transcriptional regulator [Paenibacillus lautus]